MVWYNIMNVKPLISAPRFSPYYWHLAIGLLSGSMGLLSYPTFADSPPDTSSSSAQVFTMGSIYSDPSGDITGDGILNVSDIQCVVHSLLLSNSGVTCTDPPEGSTIVISIAPPMNPG